jgi:hypothetical protein
MARKAEQPKAPPLRYRNRPVVIDAWRFSGNGEFGDRPQWLADAITDGTCRFTSPVTMDIKTLEGTMVGRAGDWIIRGVKGELYPCKPDIFNATYEAVELPT